MEHRAVRSGTSRDAKALDDALEAFALTGTRDIDELTFGEGRDGYYIAHLESRSRREANFTQDARRDFEASLVSVPKFTSRGVLWFLCGETNLDGMIAISFEGLDLDD